MSPQTISDEPEFIGQTESSRPVEIRPQVTGILKERFFSEGRDVKKRAPLPNRSGAVSGRLSQRQGKIAQAQARLVQAKQNLDRVKPLLAEQAVKPERCGRCDRGRPSRPKPLWQGANADVVKAKFDLDNTRIVAPIAGRIERSRVFEGRLLSAQTDLLTIIHQLDPMYVYASAPGDLRPQTLSGSRGKAHSRRNTLRTTRGDHICRWQQRIPHQGAFDMLDVGVRTATGTRDFRVTFSNPEKALAPGSSSNFRVIRAVKNRCHSGSSEGRPARAEGQQWSL